MQSRNQKFLAAVIYVEKLDRSEYLHGLNRSDRVLLTILVANWERLLMLKKLVIGRR